ncbi:MAG: ParB/RepB/Spo0J family partition protein [Parafilimonas terrae]|nr:ParB/RepB/Spo0J family partition protein [Parafilimonas terrae]
MSKGKLDKATDNMSESLGVPASGEAPKPAAREKPAKFQGVKNRNMMELETDKVIGDPDQPRKEFDEAELEGLAHSIRTRGQLQPGSVRWDEARNSWVVVSGERRLRACRLAGAKFLAYDYGSGTEASQLYVDQVIENAQRADLNPRDQAAAYQAIIETGKVKNAFELANMLGLSPSIVSRSLAVLTLPEAVQDDVASGEIPASSAHEIAKLPTPELQQEVADKVKSEKMTRDETREFVAEKAAEAAESQPAEAGAKPRRAGAARGVRASTKSRAKANKLTRWTEKTPSGYKVDVNWGRGIELPKLAEDFRQLASKIEGQLAEAG